MKIANNLDMGQLQILNAVIQNLATIPSTPVTGQIYFNTVINALMVFNGSAWRPLDSAALTDGSIHISALETNPLARVNHTGTQTASTISNFQATVLSYTLDQFAQAVASLNLGGYELKGIGTATIATSAVRLDQMNTAIAAAIAGQTSIKNPVRAYAATNITLSGTQTVDGVTLVAGDRVLVGNQTTATQNNIYVVGSGAWTIPTDAATTGEWLEGTEVLVTEGTVYNGSIFSQTTAGTPIIGTNALAFTQRNKINTYTADNQTTLLTGYQFSVKIDPAGLLTSSASGLAINKALVAQRYPTTITGDGTTTVFTVTHNLNTQNISCSIRDSAFNEIITDNQGDTVNSCKITFGLPPANSVVYNILILG